MRELPRLDRREAEHDAVARGYESASLRGGPVVMIAGGVAVVLAGILAGVWLLERSFREDNPVTDAPLFSRSTASSAAPPLQPQADHASLDAWDLRQMRDAENAVFAQLGWTSKPDDTGVRVPNVIIERLRERQKTVAATQKGGG